MQAAKYIYGCSMMGGTFSSALGKGAKIDCLVKVNVTTLIAKGLRRADSRGERGDPVDERAMREIWEMQSKQSGVDEKDLIRVFRLPGGCYAQEVSFVPMESGQDEDEGWLPT
jgi:hypothetical protein